MTDENAHAQWELMKATVRQLYLVENKTLPEVLKELWEREGLKATLVSLLYCTFFIYLYFRHGLTCMEGALHVARPSWS